MTAALGRRNAMLYGLLGLPLAFAALPLYVILPNHYAREFGVPLAALGAVLLAARLFDALLDPWLGRLTDRLLARSPHMLLRWGALAAVLLAAGMVLLFFPDRLLHAPETSDLLVWAAIMLVVTYLGFSLLSIAHQAWGALLGGDEGQRSRITGVREGFALVGVLIASVLPGWLGLPTAMAVFTAFLLLGWWCWRSSLPPPAPKSDGTGASSVWLPLREPCFRRLLGVFMLNGIASAVPATLVLFFVQDRLQAPAAMEPAFLGSYFLSAALSMPLWLAAVKRWGLERSWLAGMLASVGLFVGAAQLSTGDTTAFLWICVGSGLALGADLALPGALLAGMISHSSAGSRVAGACFGWWNFAAKLNLALAAGLALPLLQWLGYAPGVREPQALQALTWAYCLLPCLLKLLAALALYLAIMRADLRPTWESHR
jgi:Na+/melibiose symporter-like transporter